MSLEAAQRAVWAEDDYAAGVTACLHQVSPLEPLLHRGGRVLDVGCGIGRLLIPLAVRYPAAELVGIDPSSAMLSWAKAEAERVCVQVDLRCGDASTVALLPALDGFYSVVTLQHLPVSAQAGYLTAISRVLVSGGVGRFQVVTDTEPGPLSNPAAVDEVRRWCDEAGLTVVEVDDDPAVACWAWFTRHQAMSSAQVPVVWLSYHRPTITPRGCWDTGQFELILSRQWWRPVDAIDYSHHIGFEELPRNADGAVVIIGAQHHHLPDEVARLNADLARLRWVVLVLAGDECSLYPWARVEHPNMRLWIMTPRTHLHGSVPEHSTFIGEGYREDTPALLAACAAEAAERPLDWAFAGQVTHSRRRDLVAALGRLSGRYKGDLVETPGFLQGLPRGEYLRRMASAKIVPCPAGPGTPDSFRLYEALEAGCLPLADAVTPEGWPGYWPFVYGDDLPFPVVEDWADLPEIMEAALAGWPANANRASAWWQAEKRRLAYRLDDDVRAVRGG